MGIDGSRYPHHDVLVTPTTGRVIRAQPGITLKWPGEDYVDRAIWTGNHPLTVDESVGIIQGWVCECLDESSQHKWCHSEDRNLPKRLLQVDFTGSEKRLRLTENDGDQKGRYAALSHCWGSPSLVAKTTRENFNNHLGNISLSYLPKSFQDAAEVAWRLGVRYLWIDSLCIIQDDETDWKHESAKMNAVYENAFITIAATASSSCEEGFQFYRQPAKCIGSMGYNKRPFYLRREADPRTLRSQPVFQRGWTLQETVLSRRLVHFAEDQLYWFCRSFVHSEDGMYNFRAAPLDQLSSVPRVTAHAMWWNWVEDYSRRKLTVAQDKPPAIAGLMRKFQELTKTAPAVGLWIEDIRYGLLWWSTKPAARTLPDMPSWSWASIDGPVRPLYKRRPIAPRTLQTQAVIGPQDLVVRWEGEEFTSKISQESLHIAGRLRQADYISGYSIVFAISPDHLWQDNPRYRHMGNWFTMCTMARYAVARAVSSSTTVGVCPQNVILSDIWCLQISTDSSKERHDKHNFLILEPTGQEENVYRRIGVGCVSDGQLLGGRDFFRNIEVQEITLI